VDRNVGSGRGRTGAKVMAGCYKTGHDLLLKISYHFIIHQSPFCLKNSNKKHDIVYRDRWYTVLHVTAQDGRVFRSLEKLSKTH
jgi:hypothetical protein